MPKGVTKTVGQFISEAVRFLAKKSQDAQEIILDNVKRDLGEANRAAASAAAGGDANSGEGEGVAPAAPKAKAKKKKKKLKGASTAEEIAGAGEEAPAEE